MQILRYAEQPEFVEAENSPKTLGWVIDDEDVLRDAVASAYLGRAVAWHALYSEGKETREYTRDGQNMHDVWQAHAELATKVRTWRPAYSLNQQILSRYHADPKMHLDESPDA